MSSEAKREVAVIGSGIAGMTSAHFLSQKYNVEIYEAAAGPGMDAHSLSLGTEKGQRVDVPIRSFSLHYYPNLLALYKFIGIELQSVNYCQSLSNVGGNVLFEYSNWVVAGLSLPYCNLIKHRKYVGDFLKFQMHCWWQCGDPRLESITFEQMVKECNVSTEFAENFLYPVCSVTLSCKLQTVKDYPADILVAFFGIRHTALLTGWMRAADGACEVCDKLLAPIPKEKCFFGKRVARVVAKDVNGKEKVEVCLEDGTSKLYDEVVMATEANCALKMLEDTTPQEREILSSFKYEPSRVSVHSDETIMPVEREMWRTMNIMHPPETEYKARIPLPENYLMGNITVWMNKLVDIPDSLGNVFQTWNPLVEPEKDKVLSESTFQRAIQTLQSAKCVGRLPEIQGKRHIWFCGSYASRGMTLLEQAVTSSLHVSKELSCSPPWEITYPRSADESRKCGTLSTAILATSALVVSGLFIALVSPLFRKKSQ